MIKIIKKINFKVFKTGEKRRNKLASIKRNKWWLPTKINLLTPLVHAMMEVFCDQAVVDGNVPVMNGEVPVMNGAYTLSFSKQRSTPSEAKNNNQSMKRRG